MEFPLSGLISAVLTSTFARPDKSPKGENSLEAAQGKNHLVASLIRLN